GVVYIIDGLLFEQEPYLRDLLPPPTAPSYRFIIRMVDPSQQQRHRIDRQNPDPFAPPNLPSADQLHQQLLDRFQPPPLPPPMDFGPDSNQLTPPEEEKEEQSTPPFPFQPRSPSQGIKPKNQPTPPPPEPE